MYRDVLKTNVKIIKNYEGNYFNRSNDQIGFIEKRQVISYLKLQQDYK